MAERRTKGIHFGDDTIQAQKLSTPTKPRRQTSVSIVGSQGGSIETTPQSSRRSIFRGRRSIFTSVGSFSEGKRPSLKYEPTYRLYPAIEFHVTHIQKMLELILNQKFSEFTKYDAKKINRECQRISISTLTRIKSMNFDRYRIICLITAGEKFFQDINYKTGFLWDRERDKWATYVYETQDFYVCATVYGIYYD